MGRYRTRTAFRDTPLLAALRVLQLSGGWRPPLPPQGGLQGWGREARSLIEPWPLQYKTGELFPPHLLHLPRPHPRHHLIPTDTQAGRKGHLPCTATMGQAWSTQQTPEPGFKPDLSGSKALWASRGGVRPGCGVKPGSWFLGDQVT